LHLTFYVFPIVDGLERVPYCGGRNEILKLADVEALSPTVDQDYRPTAQDWGTRRGGGGYVNGHRNAGRDSLTSRCNTAFLSVAG